MDFAKLFHFASKRHKKTPPEKEWPLEWKTIYYKVYDRFPKIILPDPMDDVLKKEYLEIPNYRKSRRNFKKGIISTKNISTLLKYSSGIIRNENGSNIRAHPSGGGRYPLEIYLILPSGSDELSSGLYHYNIRYHVLECIYQKELNNAEILDLFTYPFCADVDMFVVITSVFQRMTDKYGQRGYRHILLEAGHVGQNFCNIATLLNLKICPLSGTKDLALENFLDIDGNTESVVYALAIGNNSTS